MVYLTVAALLASGLLASVSAGNVQHQAHGHGHLHRRNNAEQPPKYNSPAQYQPSTPKEAAPKYEIPAELQPNATTCGCSTYTTTWYGEATLYNPHKPSSSSTSVEAKPSQPAPAPAPKPYSPPKPAAPEAPKTPSGPSDNAPPKQPAPPAHSPPQQQDQPKPAPAPQSSTDKPSNSGGIQPNGNQWAMTYTPYRADGGCKSAGEVNSDISKIKSKGFNTVRLYATDCSGPENVGAACKANGMSIILGIFIDTKGLGAAHEQAQDLMDWGKNGNNWSMVVMVVAGNEAIFSGAVAAQDMASFLTDIKPQFKSAGYNGPITTTEPLNVMQANSATLCPVIDVVGGNLHPFFNGQYSASQAGELVAQQLKDLAACCGGSKEAYNLETGWPSQGQANGVAVPGEKEQKEAIESIMGKVGGKSVFLSYEDDTWKAPGEYGIEQHWGCASVFGD
ncbi:putative beta-glucosidase btgE [Cercospora beticola]|uniref:Probable beta-glucosidase btgE n=1 Tax=Cercospora beticola TaxID=122368 RepID=A0A2G5HP17_CERBT|nr:putative beta-glucosidase btgE [Cercospora beticola]PIA93942.1 putative beta-glucosidase btgE [Cercospora beticola]WPB02010.1 hypothetical protein RHO25_006644 [Cercospora beticola]CAK1363139.1 unnamed protein product [Cercospora beticola]